ncbi:MULTISPECIES: hypothetical protein [Halobellus]|jgi:hypothetical protein|uniref:hypothetical protein n=1 Tax=Halobellus TaxID=1073986 RepID=UPI00288082B4|nr:MULTISPECIES: hypothetical protein [unclassified Halobellus]
MTRRRSAVLWGLIGALSFLVLLQGYRLLVGPLDVSTAAAAGVALFVGVVVTLLAYVAEPRMRAKGRT